MKALKARWLLVADKLNALSVRERGIIFSALLVVIYMLFQILAFDALIADQKKLTKSEQSLNSKINQVRVENAQVIADAQIDPNKKTRSKIGEEQAKSKQLTEEIQNVTDKLIEPSQMASVLDSLLDKSSGLKLLSVKTKDPKVYFTTGDANNKVKNDEDIKLWQHTMVLELEGKYGQVQDYLAAIESLPKRLFWQELNYQMEKYPVGRLKLEVYTISTSEDFIGVYQ